MRDTVTVSSEEPTEPAGAGARFLDDIPDDIRDGVAEAVTAVTALGTGFARHPGNRLFQPDADPRENADPHLMKRALLRLVYRLLLWFAAEDRDVLHPFSARRLRQAAFESRPHEEQSHADQPRDGLWPAVRRVLSGLGDENGLPDLGLPGLGGIFDETAADQVLRGLALPDEYLLAAVRSLSRIQALASGGELGASGGELGAVCEPLLELTPGWSESGRAFTLTAASGSQRKGARPAVGTGRTPAPLVDCLLDSSLDPVLDAAVERGRREAARKKHADESGEVAKALLSVRVCDPACGSGQLLAAAARRIAERLAAVREHSPQTGEHGPRAGEHGPQTGEHGPEPSPDALRHALRDVVTHCVYGVDISDLAVELAKVSLWLESVVPGKALSFLDSHVRRGNSLIGATPALLENGIPDSAFKPAEGDDPKFARSLLRANVKPGPGQVTLFRDQESYTQSNEAMAKGLAKIARLPGGSLREVRRQAAEYQKWRDTRDNRFKRLVADAWCAAFPWPKRADAPPAIVNRALLDLRERGADGILPATLTEIERLREKHGFFHWHLEFPDVFRLPAGETQWRGGFSCVLSRPPADKVDRRGSKAVFGFASRSGTYPESAQVLTEPGVTTLWADQLFTERVAMITAPAGRAGCVVPTATVTTADGRHLFASLMRRGAVASVYAFENGPCLLTLTGPQSPGPPSPGPPSPGKEPSRETATFAFSLREPAELSDTGRTFTLTPDEIALVNPNTEALPAFRSRRDAELITRIHRHVPVLWNETKADGNPWKMRLEPAFLRAAGDAGLFRTGQALRDEGWELTGNVFTRDGMRMLPVYEPPMAYHFDHRHRSFDGAGKDDHHGLADVDKRDPSALAQPRYWVAEHGPVAVQRKGGIAERPGVCERLKELGWSWDWLCGWRRGCSPADERTAVPAFLPRTAVAESFPLMLPRVVPPFAAALIAAQSSLVFDFVARQKLDGVSMRPETWKQLPVPAPETMEAHLPFIVPRVLELVYTAYDMTPLARDLDDAGEPFVWDEDRRAGLRAELDAFFFRLYGIDDRDDVDYILETFPAQTGTKRLVLDAYDRMTAADAAGHPYETRLIRQPGHGDRHPPRGQPS